MSLLHLDDPDRLRATAKLYGTGKRWRPLPDASTRTRDLALSPSLFHWESQSTTTAASPTGGVTEPFRCLGFVRYESHEGERPMAIRWRLERAIPAGWMQGMALAV